MGDNSVLLEKFFSSNPECDPSNDTYVGNYTGNCGDDYANGAKCSLASTFGAGSTSSDCVKSVTNQIYQVINGDGKSLGLKSCQSQLFGTFVSNAMSELSADNGYLQGALSVQQNYFDSSLKLMEAEVQNNIDIENLTSGAIFILALVIVSYLLFIKIFV